MKKCLFYGTLRSGQEGKNSGREKVYNFNRFGGQIYQKTLRIKGFKMYSLGPYPCIAEGDGEITVELHDVEDQAAQYIAGMERGAGYQAKTVNIDGTDATIYYYERVPARIQNAEIKSGDWCD